MVVSIGWFPLAIVHSLGWCHRMTPVWHPLSGRNFAFQETWSFFTQQSGREIPSTWCWCEPSECGGGCRGTRPLGRLWPSWNHVKNGWKLQVDEFIQEINIQTSFFRGATIRHEIKHRKITWVIGWLDDFWFLDKILETLEEGETQPRMWVPNI